MRVHSAPAPRRLLFAALVVIVTSGLWMARGAPPNSRALAATWTTSGVVGTAQIPDTSGSPGATCNSILPIATPVVDITVKGPTVSAANAHASQPIDWRAMVYELLPGGRTVLLQTSSPVGRQVDRGTPFTFPSHSFWDLAVGPTYFVVVEVRWYDPSTSPTDRIEGTATYRVQTHRTTTTTSGRTQAIGTGATCVPPLAPTATLAGSSGYVGTSLGFTIRYFPIGTKVNLRWDGQNLGTVLADSQGRLSSSFQIPPSPLGQHTIRWFTGTWSVTAKFTIEPRIRASPSRIARGQTLSVSLRGYAAGETVRIRWKRGGSWVELTRVTTTATGSADLTIVVPTWAPDGTASIRGDGSQGRAQTNGVTVSGGTFRPAEASPTPTPTPTATATTTPTMAATPSPATEPPTPTTPPTQEPSTPTPDPIAEETAPPTPSPAEIPPEPTATATATSTPTTDPGSSQAEPTTASIVYLR